MLAWVHVCESDAAREREAEHSSLAFAAAAARLVLALDAGSFLGPRLVCARRALSGQNDTARRSSAQRGCSRELETHSTMSFSCTTRNHESAKLARAELARRAKRTGSMMSTLELGSKSKPCARVSASALHLLQLTKAVPYLRSAIGKTESCPSQGRWQSRLQGRRLSSCHHSP